MSERKMVPIYTLRCGGEWYLAVGRWGRDEYAAVKETREVIRAALARKRPRPAARRGRSK